MPMPIEANDDGDAREQALLRDLGRVVRVLGRGAMRGGGGRPRRGAVPGRALADRLRPGAVVAVRAPESAPWPGGVRRRARAVRGVAGFGRVRDDRLERVLEVVGDVRRPGAQRVRDADQSADGREDREHDERHGHHPRRLVRLDGAVMVMLVAPPRRRRSRRTRGASRARRRVARRRGRRRGREPRRRARGAGGRLSEARRASCGFSPSSCACACASSAWPPACASRKRSLPQKVITIMRVM